MKGKAQREQYPLVKLRESPKRTISVSVRESPERTISASGGSGARGQYLLAVDLGKLERESPKRTREQYLLAVDLDAF